MKITCVIDRFVIEPENDADMVLLHHYENMPLTYKFDFWEEIKDGKNIKKPILYLDFEEKENML